MPRSHEIFNWRADDASQTSPSGKTDRHGPREGDLLRLKTIGRLVREQTPGAPEQPLPEGKVFDNLPIPDAIEFGLGEHDQVRVSDAMRANALAFGGWQNAEYELLYMRAQSSERQSHFFGRIKTIVYTGPELMIIQGKVTFSKGDVRYSYFVFCHVNDTSDDRGGFGSPPQLVKRESVWIEELQKDHPGKRLGFD